MGKICVVFYETLMEDVMKIENKRKEKKNGRKDERK